MNLILAETLIYMNILRVVMVVSAALVCTAIAIYMSNDGGMA